MTELEQSINELGKKIEAIVKTRKLTSELSELQKELGHKKIELFSKDGKCEVCGIKVDNDFVFSGVCSVDGEVNGKCKVHKDLVRCDCGKGVEKTGHFQISGRGILDFISFCDKECRKNARKIAKLKVVEYKRSFSLLKDPK